MRNGRGEPFIQVNQVAGIKADTEKRIAQVPVDDVEQLTPSYADPDVLVPLHDRAEIGCNQLVDIVADRRWKHLCALHQESPTRIVAAPIPQPREYRVARLQHAAGRAGQPQRRSLTAEQDGMV